MRNGWAAVAALLLTISVLPAYAQTTHNDDTCDISVTPAATLLLPYFEVDLASTNGKTTLFSVTNVSPLPQIARVTLWTDFAFPTYTFDMFLTGYGVRSVNMRDVFTTGALPPAAVGPMPGPLSASNYANPNHLISMPSDCSARPSTIPASVLTDLKMIFTTGRSTGAGILCNTTSTVLGGIHTLAAGYATVDVVATCGSRSPYSPDYYTNDLLFDNVLIGDYEDINANPINGNSAGGTPMVHIRAIPEGGPAGSQPGTKLPYTFYDRYTVGLKGYARTVDRRQPLPAAFAARYIQGGTGAFNTNFHIWREAFSGAGASCSAYVNNNSNGGVSEMTRFDEHENSTATGGGILLWAPPPGAPGLPATASQASSSIYFPPISSSGDVAGWIYMNLGNGGSAAYSSSRPGFSGIGTATNVGVRQSQNWVVISHSAEGRFSVMYDAAPLANGCSVAPYPGTQISPGPNQTP